MMAEHVDTEELSEEQELQSQLEKICIEYQTLVETSQNMAPKGTAAKRTDPTGENNVDDDFEEIANVADNLNSLESALDLIEERADRIREQLLELLNSNREIRQSIREENDNKVNEDKPNDKPDADDASPPSDSNQNEPNNP